MVQSKSSTRQTWREALVDAQLAERQEDPFRALHNPYGYLCWTDQVLVQKNKFFRIPACLWTDIAAIRQSSGRAEVQVTVHVEGNDWNVQQYIHSKLQPVSSRQPAGRSQQEGIGDETQARHVIRPFGPYDAQLIRFSGATFSGVSSGSWGGGELLKTIVASAAVRVTGHGLKPPGHNPTDNHARTPVEC